MLMEEGPIEKGLQAGAQPVSQQPQPVPPEGVQAGDQHPKPKPVPPEGVQAGGQPVPQQPQPVPPEGVQAGGQCVPHPRERTRGWTCQR